MNHDNEKKKEDQGMHVRHNRINAILLIGTSMLFIGSITCHILDNGWNHSIFSSLILAGVFIILGIQSYRQPLFYINDHTLIVNTTLVGLFKKSYHFDSFNQIQFEERKIFIDKDGKRQELKVTRWMADIQDWNAFKTFIDSQIIKEKQ